MPGGSEGFPVRTTLWEPRKEKVVWGAFGVANDMAEKSHLSDGD